MPIAGERAIRIRLSRWGTGTPGFQSSIRPKGSHIDDYVVNLLSALIRSVRSALITGWSKLVSNAGPRPKPPPKNRRHRAAKVCTSTSRAALLSQFLQVQRVYRKIAVVPADSSPIIRHGGA
jgi:hypothetical protein